MWLMQNGMGNPDNGGAASVDYMHLFGLVALGQMWLMQARVAAEKLKAGPDEAMTTKLTLAKFYFERMLPETALRLTRMQAGAATVMALPAEAF